MVAKNKEEFGSIELNYSDIDCTVFMKASISMLDSVDNSSIPITGSQQ